MSREPLGLKRSPAMALMAIADNYLLLEHNVDRGWNYGVERRFESLVGIAEAPSA